MCYNMNKLWGHNDEDNQPVTKDTTWSTFMRYIYEISGKIVETKELWKQNIDSGFQGLWSWAFDGILVSQNKQVLGICYTSLQI